MTTLERPEMSEATKAAILATLPAAGQVQFAAFRDLLTPEQWGHLLRFSLNFVPTLLPGNLLGYDVSDIRQWLAEFTPTPQSS